MIQFYSALHMQCAHYTLWHYHMELDELSEPHFAPWLRDKQGQRSAVFERDYVCPCINPHTSIIKTRACMCLLKVDGKLLLNKISNTATCYSGTRQSSSCHLPSVLMRESSRPWAAAVVAAPSWLYCLYQQTRYSGSWTTPYKVRIAPFNNSVENIDLFCSECNGLHALLSIPWCSCVNRMYRWYCE